MSRRASEGESASTASMREPSTRCAVAARNAESTPPEYATIRLSNCFSRVSSARSLPPRSGVPASPLAAAPVPISFACALAAMAPIIPLAAFLQPFRQARESRLLFDAPGPRQ